MPSKWIDHVKAYAAKHKMSYRDALKDPKCKSAYSPSKAKASVSPKCSECKMHGEGIKGGAFDVRRDDDLAEEDARRREERLNSIRQTRARNVDMAERWIAYFSYVYTLLTWLYQQGNQDAYTFMTSINPTMDRFEQFIQNTNAIDFDADLIQSATELGRRIVSAFGTLRDLEQEMIEQQAQEGNMQGGKMKGPCWKGYEQLGMKTKKGKQVPNCVPSKKIKSGGSLDLDPLLFLAASCVGVPAAAYGIGRLCSSLRNNLVVPQAPQGMDIEAGQEETKFEPIVPGNGLRAIARKMHGKGMKGGMIANERSDIETIRNGLVTAINMLTTRNSADIERTRDGMTADDYNRAVRLNNEVYALLTEIRGTDRLRYLQQIERDADRMLREIARIIRDAEANMGITNQGIAELRRGPTPSQGAGMCGKGQQSSKVIPEDTLFFDSRPQWVLHDSNFIPIDELDDEELSKYIDVLRSDEMATKTRKFLNKGKTAEEKREKKFLNNNIKLLNKYIPLYVAEYKKRTGISRELIGTGATISAIANEDDDNFVLQSYLSLNQQQKAAVRASMERSLQILINMRLASQEMQSADPGNQSYANKTNEIIQQIQDLERIRDIISEFEFNADDINSDDGFLGGGIHKNENSYVQSVVFDKSMFDKKSASEWLKKHNYVNKGVDDKENTLRFRQVNPSYIKKMGFTNFKNKKIGKKSGIMLVLAYKSGK